MTDLPTYRLDRVFKAPRSMVWRAWTDPVLLARWYGPGIETIIHRFELKPGGVWLNEMKWGGNSNLSKMVFQNIISEEKLVWHQSSTDRDWNTIANPMMETWPKVLESVVEFIDDGGHTTVRMTMVPVGATDDEMAAFGASMHGMDGGWGKGYAVMDELFAELLASGEGH